MAQAASAGIDELRAAMDGPVIAPGDAGFDGGRRVWNAGIDRRPSAIARCASAADVAAAIGVARQHGLEVSVRAGAHNTAGTAVSDGGLMIDLTLLNSVTVDPATRRARVGGGALLSRKYGLTIDNLLSAEVVTATGQVLRAARDENPNLFWAIRGGGGNFGVVTSFEFRLHEVDPTVQVGLFFWGLDQGPEALRLAREIVASMPPEVNAVIAALNAPPAPFVPPQHHFAPGYALVLTGFGSGPEHARLVEQIRQGTPAPLFDMVTAMPYVELQGMLDGANAWGNHCYEKGTYVEDLSDEVIDVVTAHVREKNSPMSMVLFYRLDGAFSQVGDGDTAFSGGRSPRFGVFIVGVAPDADLLSLDREWVRDLWSGLRPLAFGSGDGYVNASADFAGEQVRGSYGPATYERLAMIKAAYDPDNMFHLNANVIPAIPGM
jgi:hypothetical protein